MELLDLKNNKFILFLSQRDITHPRAGGAEVYVHNSLKELAKDINIVHLSAIHQNQSKTHEKIDNINYIRAGRNLFSVIIEGMKIYSKYKENIILVLDHSNTHQFFTFLWARQKRIFFIHQLTLEIWGYFYGNFFGNILQYFEEILIKLSKGKVITVSNSTAKDLKLRGFNDLYICPEGNFIKNTTIPQNKKGQYLVYAGRLVPYKRVEDAIKLANAVDKKLYIIGDGPESYKKRLAALIKETGSNTEMLGFVDRSTKDELIMNAYMLVMPSIREGWGLVITESANFGTPSIVYPVNGTIEAVNYGAAGFVTNKIGWLDLVDRLNAITPSEYEAIRQSAFEYSLKFTWENTAIEFKKIIKEIIEKSGVNYDQASNRYITNHI